MPIYDPAPDSVRELGSELMLRYPNYQPLVEAGVTICYLFAFPKENDQGELVGNAITVRGLKALGLCSITNAKDRAKGVPDATIILDGNHWQGASQAEQEAILDHELYHLEVVLDPDGVIKRDDRQRPKLKMRKHDREFGWFDEVAGRHGQASQESQQAKAIMDQAGQLYWPSLLAEIKPAA